MSIEIRCHICGGMVAMWDTVAYAETCSEECYDKYYTDPDKQKEPPHD